MEDSLSYRVVDGGTTLNQISLNGGLSSVKMSPDPQDPNMVNIDISICCNDANVDKQVVLWHFWGWRPTVWVNADIKFDLWLKLKAVTFSDSLG